MQINSLNLDTGAQAELDLLHGGLASSSASHKVQVSQLLYRTFAIHFDSWQCIAWAWSSNYVKALRQGMLDRTDQGTVEPLATIN